MLGAPGQAFKVAQARLGGGRIHHAMRTVGLCNRAMEMMLERAVSRRTQGKLLADQQFVKGMIADSALELEQFRLLKIGRASCRERVCPYVSLSVDAVPLKKNNK